MVVFRNWTDDWFSDTGFIDQSTSDTNVELASSEINGKFALISFYGIYYRYSKLTVIYMGF
jgi:hypothetical protein